MGKITGLEPQIKHTNRFNVYVDDQFVLGVSSLIAAKLRVGQPMTEEDLKRLENEEAFESAHDKALRFLEPRPRSTLEIKQHLAKKKIQASLIDQVIARLTGAGLLDDAAFAKYWVENREQFRPRGARALRFELQRKGLANSDIAQAVGDVDESESAFRAGWTRAQRWRSLEHRVFLEKLTAFLIRRGFTYAVAKSAVARAWDESHAEESEAETPL